MLRSAATATLAAAAVPFAACSDGATGVQTGGAFVDRARELGIDFAFDRARDGTFFMPESVAAGCALLDYDGDGRQDVYVVNGYRTPGGELRHPLGANRLYRQGPDGRFTDVTAAAGAGDEGWGMGCAVGDYDADGDLDLFVSNYGPDVLLRNEGDGTFVDVTRAAGLGDARWGSSVAFFDPDADGLLDLFVVHYLGDGSADPSQDSAGRPEYQGPSCCPGVPDLFYRNRGDGTFVDASPDLAGAKSGKGLGVAFGDLDGDGRLDVYVANDSEANFAWIQGADGTFTDRAAAMGLAFNVYGGAEAGMGLVASDLDGDLALDLFSTHLAQETNTFYRNEGAGRFRDASGPSGLGGASIDLTSFGTAALDFDLDADLDLVCVGGRVLRAPPRPGADRGPHWTPYAEQGLLCVSDGAGRFRSDPEACGEPCARIDVGRGLAVGDLDDDGDPDLLVTTGDGEVRLYVNQGRPAAEDWIGFLPVETTTMVGGLYGTQREAIGAVVTLGAGERRIRREVTRSGGYLSSHDPRALFGLRGLDEIDWVEVRWPDGANERFLPRERGRYHSLVRGTGS